MAKGIFWITIYKVVVENKVILIVYLFIVRSLSMNHMSLIPYEFEIKISGECKEFWFISKTSFHGFNTIVCGNIILVRIMADILLKNSVRVINY